MGIVSKPGLSYTEIISAYLTAALPTNIGCAGLMWAVWLVGLTNFTN